MKLHDLAQDAIHVLTIGQGTVTAGGAALDETFPKDAFADVLGEAGLEIRGERLERVASKVVVTGKARLPALALPGPGLANPLLAGEVTVVATFCVPDAAHPGALAVGLRFALPAGWVFSHSFPELVLFAGSGRERVDLDDFSLKDGFLHLTTHEGALGLGGGLEATAKPGLYFEAQWHPGDTLGLLGHPLQAVHLHGPVVIRAPAAPSVLPADAQLPWDVRDSMPGLHLQADLGPDVAFLPRHDQGLLLAKPGFRIYNPLVWPSASNGDISEVYGPSRAYVGRLSLRGAGGELARVVAEMRGMGEDDELVVFADFHALTLDRLKTALVRLAGGDDATEVLHGDAGKGGAGFGLRRATLSLGRRADGSHELRSTGLSFGMDPGIAPWSPFPAPFADLLQIAYGSVQVAVVRPFDGARRAVLAHVSGTTTFLKGPHHDGLTLDVSLSYPGFHISARQARGTKVDLGLFKTQGPGLPAFLDVDLEIADLVLRATPGSSFDVAMTVAPGTSWRIGDYAMPRLSLAFSYRVVKRESELAWHLNAGIDAGPGTKPVPLAVLLQHLGSAVAGFECSTPPPVALQALAVTEVDIRYRQGGEFAIACRGELALDGGPTLECGFTIDRGGDPVQTRLGAQLVFRPRRGEPLSFTLRLDSGSSGMTGGALAATARARVTLRGALATLASKLGLGDVPDVPHFLDVTLASLFLWFDAGSGRFLLGAATESGGTALVVLSGKDANGARRCAVLVDKTLHLGLSSLPLVGDKLAHAADGLALQDVGIESLLVVASLGVRDARDAAELNAVIDNAQAALGVGMLPRLLAPGDAGALGTTLSSGLRLQLAVRCYLDDKPQAPRALPYAFDDAHAADRSAHAGAPPPAHPASGRAPPATTWFAVQRSFGPVSVRRMGFACGAGTLRLLMDASIVVSGMRMQLQGLALSLRVEPMLRFDRSRLLESLKANAVGMSTHLDGLSLSFESGPLAIGGGLLAVTPPPAGTKYAYDGTLMMKADRWAVSAAGSFAELEDGASSFFAYGRLDAILGGPAFFFVTGLAAGFGYNRRLALPSLEALPGFPLVAPFTGAGDAGEQAGSDLQPYLSPAFGRHWVAAGVRFSSFRMLDSFALLTVVFGERLEIALLGISTLSLPRPAKAGTQSAATIAHAQLALEATWAPDDGVLKVAAQLTPASYILSKDCHLAGGFALHAWFRDEFARDDQGRPTTALVANGYRAGDFVLSIGGYHPAFSPPAHYPSVPRVAANWRVKQLSIKGSLYFALTPRAIMTGGTLDANFEAGNFKAWFNTRVDFLLCWEPLGYQASQKLLVGASYKIDWLLTTKTITVQVGVDLDLYGPPFGGKAVVDLYVCSFTIDLGARPEPPPKLTWPDFEARLLPAPAPERADEAAVCLTRAPAGLVREIAPAHPGEPGAWVVNPEKFVLVASSAIPCSEAPSLNGRRIEASGGTSPFGVPPCELSAGRLRSCMTIEWLDHKGQPVRDAADAWEVEAVTERLPAAVWGLPAQPPGERRPMSIGDLRGDQMTEALVTGYTLRPRQPARTHRTEPIALSQLAMTARTLAIADDAWARPEIARGGNHADANRREAQRYEQLGELARADLAQRRGALRTALAAHGIALSATPTTRYLARAAAQQAMLAAPSLWALGEMPS